MLYDDNYGFRIFIIMNIWTYTQKYNTSMSAKKRKQLQRKVVKKLKNIQPRILEAKLLNVAQTNKLFKYILINSKPRLAPLASSPRIYPKELVFWTITFPL